MKPKFKLFSTAKVKANSDDHSFPKGTKVTITSIDDIRGEIIYACKDDTKKQQWLYEYELKPIKNSTTSHIEKAAKNALEHIHAYTTLCTTKEEEHIFLCGYAAGLKDSK